MLKKYGEIRHAMDRLHNTRLSNYERIECLDDIRRRARARALAACLRGC